MNSRGYLNTLDTHRALDFRAGQIKLAADVDFDVWVVDDRDALARAFGSLAMRHAILRTTFAKLDDYPVQTAARSGCIPLEEIDLRSVAAGRREEEAALRCAAAVAVRPGSQRMPTPNPGCVTDPRRRGRSGQAAVRHRSRDRSGGPANRCGRLVDRCHHAFPCGQRVRRFGPSPR